MLNRIWILHRFGRNRCDLDCIGYEETAVETKSECSNQVALGNTVATLGLRKEIGSS